MQTLTIQELELVLKMLKKIDKIIKTNEFTNKWYESGHIKVVVLNNFNGLLPIVQVYRLKPEDYDNIKSAVHMEKATKDRITKFLKNNDCIYYESFEAYIYGGNILKKIKQNHLQKWD